MKWVSRFLSIAVVSWLSSFAPASVAGDATAATDVLFVARHLDVLSFPSSIYPRRRDGAHTLMDYGFTHFKVKDRGVESIEDDGEWCFAVELTADHGDTKELCITDQATNGGTYADRYPIKVRLGPDGLFHAIERPAEGASC